MMDVMKDQLNDRIIVLIQRIYDEIKVKKQLKEFISYKKEDFVNSSLNLDFKSLEDFITDVMPMIYIKSQLQNYSNRKNIINTIHVKALVNASVPDNDYNAKDYVKNLINGAIDIVALCYKSKFDNQFLFLFNVFFDELLAAGEKQIDMINDKIDKLINSDMKRRNLIPRKIHNYFNEIYNANELKSILLTRITNNNNKYSLVEFSELIPGEKNRHYIISGMGGSGKTSFLVALWGVLNEKEDILVYYVPMKYCSDSVEEFIKKKYFSGNNELFSDYMNNTQEQCYPIIIIDGLNECATLERNKTIKFINSYSRITCIISTRNDDRLFSDLESNTSAYEVEELSEYTVRNYLIEYGIEYDNNMHKNLRKLLKTPQMLWLYSESIKTSTIDNEQPLTAAAIFWHYIEKQQEKLRRYICQNAKECKYKEELIMFDILPYIGYRMNYYNKKCITEGDISHYVKEYVNNIKCSKKYDKNQFFFNSLLNEEHIAQLIYLIDKGGFIQKKDDYYFFEHDNYRDIFAAINMYKNDILYIQTGKNMLIENIKYLDNNNTLNTYYQELYDEKYINELLNQGDDEHVGNVLGDIYCYPLYEKDTTYTNVINNMKRIEKGYDLYAQDAFGMWSKAFYCEKMANLFKELKDREQEEKVNEYIRQAHNICTQVIYNVASMDFFIQCPDMKIQDRSYEEPRIFNVMGHIYNKYMVGVYHSEIALYFYEKGASKGVTFSANCAATMYEQKAYDYYYLSSINGDKWAVRKVCEYIIQNINVRIELEGNRCKYQLAEEKLLNIRDSEVNGIEMWLEKCQEEILKCKSKGKCKICFKET